MSPPHPEQPVPHDPSDRSDPDQARPTSAAPAPSRRERLLTTRLPHRARDIARDITLAVTVCAVQLAGTAAASRSQHAPRALDAGGYALLTVAALVLAVRRRFPVAVLWTTVGATLAYNLLGYPMGPIWLPPIIALVTAMAAGHRLAAYASLAVGYVGFELLSPAVRDHTGPDPVWAVGLAAWLLLLGAVAELARLRRAFRVTERRRAAEHEAARLEAERRLAGEERLRIARELHDVLAHHIALMNVQASVGLELMDAQPEQARTALTAVRQASREALGELRSVLTILKGDGPAPRNPTAGVNGLAELCARTSTGRLTVALDVDGTPFTLPAPVDLAVYRIVQEALTNVVRHADATHASVRLTYANFAVIATVTDNGTGGSPATGDGDGDDTGHGNGLRNMRERAAALDGSVDAGLLPGGGFRVAACLPAVREDDEIEDDEGAPA